MILLSCEFYNKITILQGNRMHATLKIICKADLWRKGASEVLTVGQLDSGPFFVLTRISSSFGFDVGQLLWFQSTWGRKRRVKIISTLHLSSSIPPVTTVTRVWWLPKIRRVTCKTVDAALKMKVIFAWWHICSLLSSFIDALLHLHLH